MKQRWRSRARYLVWSADPRQAVNAGSEVDRRLHFPRAQVEHGNFPGPRPAYVSDFSAGTNQDFRRSFGNLQRTDHFQGLQINDVETIGAHTERKHPAPIESWRGRIRHVWQRNPVRDLVRGRLDNGDAGSILIMSKDAAAIRRNGNTLDAFWHRNRSDEFALRQIQHAHAAGADVGGVTTLAVGRQN